MDNEVIYFLCMLLGGVLGELWRRIRKNDWDDGGGWGWAIASIALSITIAVLTEVK